MQVIIIKLPAFFEMAYDQKQELDLNRILVGTLYEDQQYSLANMYLQDYLDDYLNSYDLFNLALNVLLKNQNFIYAREMIVFADPQWQDQATKRVLEEEKNIRVEMAATQRTLAQSFYHLSDGDFRVQRERFENSFKLPLEEWWQGAKFLLLDPYINPLIRATLIETAQKLRINESVEYYWLDNKPYRINPAELGSLSDDPFYRKMKDILDRELGSDDPVANENLAANLRMQASLLYPRIGVDIKDPELWIDDMINQYHGIKGFLKVPSEQNKLFDLVNDLIKDIIQSEQNI
ncbi:hypothetical protein Q757_06580 [Oenococcus alcoholitolerans]|uniref:Uncharacterized protein n=1 Tax=Oenococcus alcoholitolerans TaxID=931074 RepID=A0ABR4XQ02_9LACO|nr:hypothetical protein Q757_06580 [Oenococcus alcoholitolerans]